MSNSQNPFLGCMIGTAVGDSVGLPAEGMSRRAVAKRFSGAWRQRLVGGFGSCSDDTEHAFLVGQSLLEAGRDPEAFGKCLARRLKWWFAAIPAGVGMATARGCVKLWLGFNPKRSGVFSAGNGPAMRAPLIGVYAADDGDLRNRLVEASTRLTHVDPKAQFGALAIAEAAACLTLDPEMSAPELLARLREVAGDDADWRALVDQIQEDLARSATVDQFADRLGLGHGVSGYVYHTVPMVVYAVLRHRVSPQTALEALYSCGGDTDTTGAIAGALLGIANGAGSFPDCWGGKIVNPPISITILAECAEALHTDSGSPVPWRWPLLPIRNAVFLLVVLCHGFRRLLP